MPTTHNFKVKLPASTTFEQAEQHVLDTIVLREATSANGITSFADLIVRSKTMSNDEPGMSYFSGTFMTFDE